MLLSLSISVSYLAILEISSWASQIGDLICYGNAGHFTMDCSSISKFLILYIYYSGYFNIRRFYSCDATWSWSGNPNPSIANRSWCIHVFNETTQMSHENFISFQLSSTFVMILKNRTEQVTSPTPKWKYTY